MKLNKIMLFFYIALPASVLMRVFQLFYTVDTKTGFFKPEYKTAAYLILAFIFVFCVALVILSFTCCKSPDTLPKKNLPLAAGSLFAAAALFCELYSELYGIRLNLYTSTPQWQRLLLGAAGILTVLYFLLYGLSAVFPIKLPPLLAVLPAVYMIVRIICSFVAISSLALISDNLLVIAAYCLLLLFFLAFGKLYNNVGNERNFRRLLAFGLTAVILCFTQSVPHIIINAVTDGGYLHTSNLANVSLAAMGTFTLLFLIFYFYGKNRE